MRAEIVLILVAHWIGDWVIQPFGQRWMGRKHEKLSHLAAHAAAYGLPLMLLLNPAWALVNAGAHGLVDGVTSRLTHRFSASGAERWFWFTMGADQLVHLLVLFETWWLLS